MYKSEQAFSEAFVHTLRTSRYLAQRLESPETGRGIPDIWCCKNGKDYWIELKNSNSIGGNLHVKWRAGQQAWALEYRRYMKRHTFTVMSMQKGFAVIPMVAHFKGNIVPTGQYVYCASLHDAILCIEGGQG